MAEFMEKKMVFELSKKIGPELKQEWSLFTNFLKDVHISTIDIARCSDIFDIFEKLSKLDKIRLGQYEILKEIFAMIDQSLVHTLNSWEEKINREVSKPSSEKGKTLAKETNDLLNRDATCMSNTIAGSVTINSNTPEVSTTMNEYQIPRDQRHDMKHANVQYFINCNNVNTTPGAHPRKTLRFIPANELKLKPTNKAFSIIYSRMDGSNTGNPPKVSEFSKVVQEHGLIGKMVPKSPGRTLVYDYFGDMIRELGSNGKVIRRHDANVKRLGYLCLSPNDETKWYCCNTKVISCVSAEGLCSDKFRSDYIAVALCVTRDNNVIVVEWKTISKMVYISRYSTVGEKQKSLEVGCYSTIHPTCVCISEGHPSTDYVLFSHETCVIVTNKDLDMIFSFKGSTTVGDDGSVSQTGYQFVSFSACSTSWTPLGNILIADSMNNTVILINNKGMFLRTVYKCNDGWSLRTMCTHSDGTFWIVTPRRFSNEEKVQIMKIDG